jgi:hypothetical protein
MFPTRDHTHPLPVSLGLAMLLAFLPLGLAAQESNDPFPADAVAYFDAASCPHGWKPYTAGAGYAAVPVRPGEGIGSTVLGPLTSGKSPRHQHDFTASVLLTDISYIGAAGGTNQNVTASGTASFSGRSDDGDANVPYIQLLVCVKRDDRHPGALPRDLLTLFGTIECASGWEPTITTTGRLEVGLPEGGNPGAAFGGDPLAKLEDRTHGHTFSGSVTTSSGGVGLGSGCCAGGYGKNGTYGYQSVSAAASSGIPYIQLLECRVRD